MGSIGDETPQGHASSGDLALYPEAEQEIKQLDNSNTFDSTDSNQRLFVVSFDGTGNKREWNPEYD